VEIILLLSSAMVAMAGSDLFVELYRVSHADKMGWVGAGAGGDGETRDNQ
jgi:hypothetical protein